MAGPHFALLQTKEAPRTERKPKSVFPLASAKRAGYGTANGRFG